MQICILDTTLRDGLQSEEISFSVSDKLNIVKLLDSFGIQIIEAGNPYANIQTQQFFREAANLTLVNAKLCAFGATRRKGVKAEDDPSLAALAAAGTEIVSVVGKSSPLHVREVLGATLEENIAMIYDSVAFLRSRGLRVIFDAEHFFDGYKEDAEYAKRVVSAAVKGGAEVVCLCDTNGGVLPQEIYSISKEIIGAFNGLQFGIHAHNDAGCAVANTMLAVEAGARQVQGTFIGFGERCGNADLSAVIPNLVLKCGAENKWALDRLTLTAAAIAEYSNLKLDARKPYVGKSAFAHKAGMHGDGVIKNTASFEHILPEAVGNKRRILISDVAGRGAVLAKIKGYADLAKDSPMLDKIVAKIKETEGEGYHYETADASLELLVRRMLGSFKKHFSLKLYRTMGEYPVAEGELSASATIKVEVDGRTEMTAASGLGPVNALDLALRKALTVFYPAIGNMHLTDYKVRVLEQNQATAAKVRVLIESTDGVTSWTTVGASKDIIEASLIALVDSIEYLLNRA